MVNSTELLDAVDAATSTLKLHSSSQHAEPHRENLLRWLDLAEVMRSTLTALIKAQETWLLLKQLFQCPAHGVSLSAQVRHAQSAA